MANDEFIKIPKLFLILGGFWPFVVTTDPINAKLYRFYSKLQTYSYVGFIASLVLKLIILIIRKEDETLILSNVNVLILVFETCVKILIFQVMKIPHMFEHVMEHELSLLKLGDLELIACYRQQVTYCRRVNLSQFMMTTFATSVFTSTALLDVYLAEDMSKYVKQPFMHDLWFPFRRETNMPWVIFFNLIMIIQGTCFNTATQATFINLMIYSSTRLKVLMVKLRKFDDIARKYYDGDVLEAVKALITEHQDVLRFVESLNTRITYVLLMEFILNEVGLASGTIQLFVIDTASRMVSVISIILLQLFQIFVMAWSANEITIQGSNIADALMASNWVTQRNTVRKMFLLMIMRAQLPIGLMAGPFFNMNAGTALTTVKAAYTYLTFMMRNYN